MQQQDGYQVRSDDYTFPQKVWITGGIFSFIVVAILLLKATFSVFLLILAGILIAVFFRGLSGLVERKTGWKSGVCLTIATIFTLLLIGFLFWLIGSKIQSQVAQLSDTLPATVENAKNQLNKSMLGQKVVEKISSPKAQQNLQSVAQTFFKTTFGVFGDVYIVLFIGIFLIVSPQLYINGLVALVPKQKQQVARDLLNKTGENLKKWLKGKIFAMFVVFVLTAVSLLIIGMPLWLVLALTAGILNFIPNFGPLIAMIPAVLIALLQGAETAALVAGIYILVQVIESNFITPLVQQKLINIPPAMIIIAQLIIAPLTGGWGLLLATPLMVIIIVFVQELYIKKQ